MSKDISTAYTKDLNKKCGRRFCSMWNREKVTVICPRNYGEFVGKKKGKKK